MKAKKLMATLLAGVMIFSLTACGSSNDSSSSAPEAPAASEAPAESEAEAPEASEGNGGTASVTLKIGFENTMDEPVGQGLQKWQELLAEENADIAIELYPNSQLGGKSDLMDSMLMGDNVVTLTDGSFYAEYGVKDFSVFYAPFLFDNWDQVWKVIDSEWYADMCSQLEEKGLHIIASNWIYGARQLMTTKEVHSLSDLAGLKIRVPDNQIQTASFNVLGASSVALALGDVYQALTSGTVDGVENPMATLYGRSFQEVSKYILLTNHVMCSTTWVCSQQVWESLTPEQQEALTKTCEAAGEYNNEVYETEDANYIKAMEEAGVTVSEMSDEEREEWKKAAEKIWDMSGDFQWSDGLKETIQGIIAE